MRILIWMPCDGSVPGGHRIQAEKTAEAVRAKGAEVSVSFAHDVEPTSYHIVHGFGLKSAQVRLCRNARVKIALSPIYWSLDYRHDQARWRTRLRFGAVLLKEALKGNYRDKCQLLTRSLNELRSAFECADILLPNSESEADGIRSELGITTPMCVVPNAVDADIFREAPRDTTRSIDVLYVGRFEPHKNQLGFIHAMRGENFQVVLLGPPHPEHPKYYERCMRAACGNVRILPGRPHDHLAEIYCNAKVHALPSWYETTGLVSLEAALCGCNIVTTDRGYAQDYFLDKATYCDPSNPKSIRRAVADAFKAPIANDLRERILSNFTWKHTADATLRAFEKLL